LEIFCWQQCSLEMAIRPLNEAAARQAPDWAGRQAFAAYYCSSEAYDRDEATDMWENLAEEVRECLRHAEECAARAKIEPHQAIQRDFIDMELRWLQLARSYQFLDRLRAFSAEHDKQSGELSARLERLKGEAPVER
jgi:hypothetical protein